MTSMADKLRSHGDPQWQEPQIDKSRGAASGDIGLDSLYSSWELEHWAVRCVVGGPSINISHY